MNDPLPEFDNPPVVEVALGVQFDSLAKLRTLQIGLLWQRFKDRFPIIEEHAPLEPQVEQFGVPSAQHPSVQFQVIRQPPVPRYWFLSDDGSKLVQVQQDRFVHNWRKAGDGNAYPRFDKTLRPGFESEFKRFCEFISSEDLGEITPNQCEVTYVNNILGGGVWSKHHELNKVFSLYSGGHSDGFLPEEERANLVGAYVLRDEVGSPVGRLHYSLEPGFRRSGQEPLFRLTLTARGRPVGEGTEGIMAFLNLGREWVVRGFASMTTKEMHKAWGRTR